MASSTGNASSGRSGYQGSRNRRRMGADVVEDSGVSSPPFFMSQGMLRISPSAPAWSPTAPASSRRQRRFFDANGSIEGTQQVSNPLPQQSKVNSLKKKQHGGLTSSSPIPSSVVRHSSTNDQTGEVIDGVDVSKLRALTNDALGTPALASLPSTAVFYASTLYAKTQSEEDAFLYAQALRRNGEPKRCVRLLEQSGLIQSKSAESRFEAVLLAAEAMSSLGEWQSTLEMLEEASQLHFADSSHANNVVWPTSHLEDDDDIGWDSLFQSVASPANFVHPVARLCLWRGRAYSETGHPIRAAFFWKRAIRMDSKCIQAMDLLLERSVISPQEAYNVIQNLTWEPEMEWLKNLYLARIELSPQDDSAETNQIEDSLSMNADSLDASAIQMTSPMLHAEVSMGDSKLEKENDEKGPSVKSPIQLDVDTAFDKLWDEYKLNRSPEVLAMAARRSYRCYDLKGALKYCQELAAIDPLCQTAGYVYVSTLAALGQKRTLFSLAHEWVESSPKSARAWFAVGSYYYACQRYHVAQRHFCRATRLDPHCTEAWIAFGCSFASCDESDQALASFRAAQRLSPGEYASLLYMGMEYLRTNHLVLAQYFLTAAFKASGGDPLCLNELGVLAIHKGDNSGAIGWFVRALRALAHDEEGRNDRKTMEECINLCQDKYWEPTIFNLGQCYRKTRHFAEAVCCFERCVALSPDNCSAYAALAFTHHLMCDFDKAIDLYHQALGVKPDDPFSSEMLNKALHEALNTTFVVDNDSQPADVASRGIKNLLIGQPNNSTPMSKSDWSAREDSSMMSDGLNLSAGSGDVDMSLA